MATPKSNCSGPECDRQEKILGLCASHYQQRRRGIELKPLGPWSRRAGFPYCSVPDCGRSRKARGLCKPHWEHVKKYGELREIRTYNVQGKVCGIKGCDGPVLAKDRCVKHLQASYNLKRFGITFQDFVDLLERQGGVCAICGGVNANGYALSVDHDHECCAGDHSCGRCIRGLLCGNCNFGVAHFRDDPARLRAAAGYVEAARMVPTG